MEIRLVLAKNHLCPLMTKRFPEREPRERVGGLDTPKAQTSVNVQVKEFWVPRTECSGPWMQLE